MGPQLGFHLQKNSTAAQGDFILTSVILFFSHKP